MQALFDAVIDLVALVSPSKIHALAGAFRRVRSPDDLPDVDSLVGSPAARCSLSSLIAAWEHSQTPAVELAGMLVGATEARKQAEEELNVELVWTGPTTRFVPTRRTEQVLLDLIGGADEDLFLVSFVAYAVPSVTKALNAASGRGVRIHMLLEASSAHGGSLDIDPAAIMRTNVPSAVIYTWKDKSAPFVDGKVHAKVAVVDGSRAFVTSANLTGYALEKNMEAGVLIRGGPVPTLLRSHLQALIDVGVIDSAHC
jgi:phosphatidylserine/phosphatidylglycerophosphate/cardiolipin synthase-like enzyme